MVARAGPRSRDRRRRRARPEATALVDGATRISYASLAARADALASRLTDGLGLERGDRIVVQLPNCWQFVVLTLGCLRAGIVPVMALPAHREHELAYLCEHSEARALAVPGVLRDFDHQDMAARCGPARRRWSTSWWPARPAPGHIDLAALCAATGGPGGGAGALGRQPAGRRGRRGVPAVRRDHRAAQADRPHPRRLCLQRPRLRGAVRPGREHGLPGHPARLAQLPARLPRHPRHPAVRRPGGDARPAQPRRCSPPSRRRRHHHRGVPAVAQRWLAHAAEHGAGHSHAACPPGGRRPARRRTGPAGPAGTRRDPAAGVRHGRRAAQLHPAGRSRRGHLRHARPAAEPRRRGAHRGRRRQRPTRRRARRAADPRSVYAARLLPGAGAERARLHPGRLVRQRRRGAPPAGRQPRGRGPGQGHDQPGRGEDLGRGGGEPRLPDAGDRPGRRRGRARRRTRRAGLRLCGAASRRRTSPWTPSGMGWRRPG